MNGKAASAFYAFEVKALKNYGFSVVVEIEPHEWEKDRILRIVYPDQRGRRIRPDEHFAAIMFDIRREAAARYGPENVPMEGAFARRASAAEQNPKIRNPEFETNPKFK
jgi:hypothetical protein